MKQCKTCIHKEVCPKVSHIENYRIDDCESYSGWISVEERLPDKNGKYIVCNRNGAVYQTKFYTYPESTGGHWGQKDKGKTIVAWMPLPEPPKIKISLCDAPYRAAESR